MSLKSLLLSAWVVLWPLSSVFLFLCNVFPAYLPFFERGHCGIEVEDSSSRQELLKLLEIGGLKIHGRFKVGPTDQTLMNDGFTVVNIIDRMYPDPTASFPGDFRSLPVADPWDAAHKAEKSIEQYGDTWESRDLQVEGKGPNMLVAVWPKRLHIGIIYRRHVVVLGEPPWMNE